MHGVWGGGGWYNAANVLILRDNALFSFSYPKLFNIESFAFLLSTEMEESSPRSYTKICRLIIREYNR